MEPDADLSEAERERVRQRDRKRERRMVVDNAGIKRVLPAIAQKRRRSAVPEPPQDSPS
jgi:hypothetical protein